MFQVTVQIGLSDGSLLDDVSFMMHVENEDDVRTRVTPEFMMENLGDYWGPPIANVTVLKITKVHEQEGDSTPV